MTLSSRGRILFAILSSYATGLVGWLSFNADWESWYAGLIKPPFTPIASVFFPVWMILYGLMGLALGVVWSKTKMWYSWIGLFYVSLAFNASWVMFFFGFHAIFVALIDVSCLAVLLTILTLCAWEIDRKSTYFLLPYLAWVFFAVYLNLGIWMLN
jgi:tryptophan-rich sensory protein